MQIQFAITPEEYTEGMVELQKRFAKLYRKQSFSKFPLRLVMFVLAAMAFQWVVLWYSDIIDQSLKPGTQLPIAPASFWFGSVILFYLLINVLPRLGSRRRSAALITESQSRLLHPRTMRFDDEGVEIEEPLSTTRYKWPMFTQLFETDHLYLLALSEVSAEMIPKRAFATIDDLRNFVSMVKQRVTATRGFPVVMTAVNPSIAIAKNGEL